VMVAPWLPMQARPRVASKTARRSPPEAESKGATATRYRAVRNRDRKGAEVWGVAAFEPRPGRPWRQVGWKTVGRGDDAGLEARALAVEMERQEAEHGERFLSWHIAGERLPLDRTVHDYVHHHSKAIGGSTARRCAQFGSPSTRTRHWRDEDDREACAGSARASTSGSSERMRGAMRSSPWRSRAVGRRARSPSTWAAAWR
jgi:hypothetical protein